MDLREAIKKRVFYGQADHKGWPPSPLYGHFFQGVHLTFDYDDMYSEADFTPEIQYMIYWQGKRVRTNEQSEDPSKHIVSIGNHEKGMQNAFFIRS